jgi:hypothetical protein
MRSWLCGTDSFQKAGFWQRPQIFAADTSLSVICLELLMTSHVRLSGIEERSPLGLIGAAGPSRPRPTKIGSAGQSVSMDKTQSRLAPSHTQNLQASEVFERCCSDL